MADADTPDGSLVLRGFAEADIAAAQAISAAVGWPHRREDWRMAWRLGSGIVAEWDGAVIGTALAWPYGGDLATIGLVTVAPAHQKRGLGRAMMHRLLPPLGDRRLMLHATKAGMPLYRELGFRPVGAIRQCEGTSFRSGPIMLPPDERLRPMVRSDLGRLVMLDEEAFGAPRGALVAALLSEARGVVLDRAGQPAGFAMLRRFGRGHVIGPVVAPDMRTAQALIGHWLGSQQGMLLRLDVPEESGLAPWLQGFGFTVSEPVEAMMRGPQLPPAGVMRRFALVSQALG